ncbi:hypothetical protein SCLCIDRAFT_120782, partial [Scleroderma citrinum Foug A]
EQWIALSYRLGIEGFFIAVRGGVDDLSGPRLFFTNKAEKFACAVLDLEPRRLALKLEAFVITGLAVIIKEKYQNDSNIRMNYNNYEGSIVERYGVALVGWPDNLLPVQNPSSVGGREVLQPLLDALVTQTCYWIRLTDDQLVKRIDDNGMHQAKGEAVYKP